MQAIQHAELNQIKSYNIAKQNNKTIKSNYSEMSIIESNLIYKAMKRVFLIPFYTENVDT